jgi:hypothetical protein
MQVSQDKKAHLSLFLKKNTADFLHYLTIYELPMKHISLFFEEKYGILEHAWGQQNLTIMSNIASKHNSPNQHQIHYYCDVSQI